ncbi:MAG: redox-regulated ATPase YchF [Candidatus Terrybacteria bacterium RIFCSPLOWO2_01_FULL_58_14]|uniref:Redox-regulated ATPase YchF n=2 Tax=Candidatus Terryibacteriota TaxID=1817920 RepID=A0A1G2PYQ0_9BACT|nr:MAG: redox-regulated ATPase YchF [Candidatus Terrybacteria bacterium RIFCSPHIGHO2_01_FULL_58_15]OHA52899.1 MAG: redox-regulated ATPase YchF [Candidatus Terrybacteria bacterium RIFCSPLOWO2_01_FULL_58_14]
MALSIGIVGLPNVGKSTLFSVLTRKAVDVSNYPFTTIDPNVGVVSVPDSRLATLAALEHSARVVPATVKFVDIAGLVKGANRGEGLGNQFLAQIREVDAIVEVVRAFTAPEIAHVEGVPDPLRDYDIVDAELALKDLEGIEKRLEQTEKEARAGAKSAQESAHALAALRDALREGTPARVKLAELRGEREREVCEREARDLALLTAKPLLVLVNATIQKEWMRAAGEFQKRRIPAVVINLREEQEAAGFVSRERQELGLGEFPLDRLIRKAFTMLGLVTFFTTGSDETRAWTIPVGTFLPQAAGAIHSDFEQQFIRGDVIGWNSLAEAGGWGHARGKGLLRSEGKSYVVREGDVIEVKHGA